MFGRRHPRQWRPLDRTDGSRTNVPPSSRSADPLPPEVKISGTGARRPPMDVPAPLPAINPPGSDRQPTHGRVKMAGWKSRSRSWRWLRSCSRSPASPGPPVRPALAAGPDRGRDRALLRSVRPGGASSRPRSCWSACPRRCCTPLPETPRWSTSRPTGAPILLLSVGLVTFTTLGIGALVHLLLPTLSGWACFAIGAVVAPPDAVAATAIGRRIGLPRRIVDGARRGVAAQRRDGAGGVADGDRGPPPLGRPQ